jgi:hypothetical protein
MEVKMKILRFTFILFFILFFIVTFNLLISAQEGNIPKSKLPKAVVEAVQKKIPGARILSAYVEREEGELRYEITAEAKGVMYAIEITANGIIREFSEEKMVGKAEVEEEKEVEGGKFYNFDSEKIGALPEGWSAYVTGRGPNSKWEIQKMEDAPSTPNVLVQVSQPRVNYHFNVAVDKNSNYSDLELSVWLKAIKGKIDQGGGLVWRFKDANNYYIARVNPLENNFRVYKVINGRRILLQSARIPLKARKWYVMRIENKGNKIVCFLDGNKYLEARDNTFKTGKIGLWTKADAVTAFDNLRVKEEKEE